MPFRIKWLDKQFRRLVDRGKQQACEALAYEGRERARQILQEDGHIDTGFLYRSIYAATPNGVSPTPPSGIYTDRAGNAVRRNAQEAVQVDEGAALGAAADHAIWIELQDPFLHRALNEMHGKGAERVVSSVRWE